MGNWEDEFRMVAAERGYGLRQCHFDLLSGKWEVLLDDGSERGLEIIRGTTVKIKVAIRELPERTAPDPEPQRSIEKLRAMGALSEDELEIAGATDGFTVFSDADPGL